MRRTMRRVLLTLGMVSGVGSGIASAQVFGTFAWQMQPYCNIVTLTITQVPGGFTLDGNDNLCGAGGKLAGANGMALINPDGTVGLEFTIVNAPSGLPVHVSASLNPGTGSGTWKDSAGNSGNMALGAPGSGSPRPLPSVGLTRTVVSSSILVPAGNISPQTGAISTPSCPGGTTLVGGGAGWGGLNVDLYLVGSEPNGNSWVGAYRSERSAAVTFSVFAICVK